MFNCAMEGLDLLNAHGVTLTRETVDLFFEAGLNMDALGEAVDVLLDSEKRLGVHIKRDKVRRVLFM